MKFSTILLAPLLAASYVSAHGTPTQVDVDGGGSFPLKDGSKNAIRPVDKPDPNLLLDDNGNPNPALTCGPGARAAPHLIDVQPGQTLKIHWQNGQWPHNTGPILSYMAQCDGGCVKFDASKSQWFKISEQGIKSPSTWFQNDVFFNTSSGKGGLPASVTIPDKLKEGEYLLRHEIIALHRLQVGGDAPSPAKTVEFYPGCIQLRVGSSGSNGIVPTTNLLQFPGAYSVEDFRQNVFDAKLQYIFPGGPIAPELSGGGSAQGDPPSTTTSRKPSSTPKPSNTGPGNVNAESPPSSLPSSVTTPKVCKTKSPKPSSSSSPPVNAEDPANTSDPTPTPTPTPSATDGYRRRRLGRIMRRRAENEMGLH